MNTQEANKTIENTSSISHNSKFKTNWEKELHIENVKVFKKIFGVKDAENKLGLLN
jgi:hypothetical protein